ncbi:MAG: glycosyltransferase family 4 protein [Mariprofundaceae bacterium]
MKDNNLRVLFYLCGDSNKASSRVRGFWIAEALKEQGDHCTLRWNDSKIDLLCFALAIPGHDIIIFQKTYSSYHRWLMKLAKMMGKRCYIDIDDAPSKINAPKTLKNFESMASMANGAFAGSQNLFDYCKRHQVNTHLIPSSIYLKYYQMVRLKPANDKICLGWIGNGAHYKKDLVEILAKPLKELSTRHEIRLKLVGACGEKELYDVFGNIDGLEIDFIDAIKWSDPAAVSSAICDFDIGLYPLLPSDFNHYKCGFKALEYMAVGMPVIASSVAINADIITHGEDGLLVDTSNEWVAALDELIVNLDKQIQMGKLGRSKVEFKFNVEKTASLIKSIVLKDV